MELTRTEMRAEPCSAEKSKGLKPGKGLDWMEAQEAGTRCTRGKEKEMRWERPHHAWSCPPGEVWGFILCEMGSDCRVVSRTEL